MSVPERSLLRPGTGGRVRAVLEGLTLAGGHVWASLARPEQLPPEGDWRVWYIRGGRGSGKTRTGGETLAEWIRTSDPGEWAIVAPTFGDARSVCVEGDAGLLKALGKENVTGWNRSEGVVTTGNGSKVYLDGGDDGALRIQGKNLRGCWADEVGLWRDWDRAWNESIAFAVRVQPAKIIATGTPKMAHPLIRQLLESENVVQTHMRPADNAANLDEAALAAMIAEFGGSTLGRQELEGEYIEALEGDILPRHAWAFFDVAYPVSAAAIPHLRFDQIIHSWDTALKAKTSSDNVAGQAWGCAGPDRYLLRLYCGHATLEATVLHMSELLEWSRAEWPGVPHRVLVETSANGADAIAEMRRRVDGVYPVNPRDGGDKVRRALTAAPALETGHCHLPGVKDADPSSRGYTSATHEFVQAFVEECADFRHDLRHAHDDQVDAWSQMVNWTRAQVRSPARLSRRVSGPPPRAGSLTGV